MKLNNKTAWIVKFYNFKTFSGFAKHGLLKKGIIFGLSLLFKKL